MGSGKERENKAKHGVDFETAELVFDDPFCINFVDRVTDGEERWHAIGSVEDVIVLVVVHTYRMEGSDEIIRIISARPATRREGSYMSKLSAEKRKQLQKLSAKPDREIDLTDIPEMREIPSDAVIGRFYRPKKSTVTIRLDADVLAWLKATGEGYQTRINAYLREMMQRNR
jgi:uncharacterized DUF497 family protein